MQSRVVRRPPRRSLVVGVSALAIAMLAVPNPLRAQSATTAPTAATAAPCDSAQYRQFDFWVGRWEVRNPKGGLAGTSHVERMPGGCALVEHWTGAGGGLGTSLNFFDRATGQWNQLWVDGRGGVLRLTGGREGDAMVLRGTAPGPDGAPRQQRITWSPLGGGRVRQHWETSADGERWQTSFDGTYTPTTGGP